MLDGRSTGFVSNVCRVRSPVSHTLAAEHGRGVTRTSSRRLCRLCCKAPHCARKWVSTSSGSRTFGATAVCATRCASRHEGSAPAQMRTRGSAWALSTDRPAHRTRLVRSDLRTWAKSRGNRHRRREDAALRAQAPDAEDVFPYVPCPCAGRQEGGPLCSCAPARRVSASPRTDGHACFALRVGGYGKVRETILT